MSVHLNMGELKPGLTSLKISNRDKATGEKAIDVRNVKYHVVPHLMTMEA